MSQVYSYATGDEMLGTASEELELASAEAGETGAVAAYRDDAGTWQYADARQMSQFRRMGAEVHVVYVA